MMNSNAISNLIIKPHNQPTTNRPIEHLSHRDNDCAFDFEGRASLYLAELASSVIADHNCRQYTVLYCCHRLPTLGINNRSPSPMCCCYCQ